MIYLVCLLVFLMLVGAVGISLSLAKIPFGSPKTKVGRHYIDEGIKETGAVNIVTSAVVNYRGFDTLALLPNKYRRRLRLPNPLMLNSPRMIARKRSRSSPEKRLNPR